jgi:hypothetical protein
MLHLEGNIITSIQHTQSLACLLWLIFTVLLYFESLEQDSKVTFNPFDYLHLLTVALIRILIISTKYGYYSLEHMKMLRKIRLSDQMRRFDLTLTSVHDRNPEILYDRLKISLESLEISEEEFFFMIDEDQLEGFERLKSKEAMKESWVNKKAWEVKPYNLDDVKRIKEVTED